MLVVFFFLTFPYDNLVINLIDRLFLLLTDYMSIIPCNLISEIPWLFYHYYDLIYLFINFKKKIVDSFEKQANMGLSQIICIFYAITCLLKYEWNVSIRLFFLIFFKDWVGLFCNYKCVLTFVYFKVRINTCVIIPLITFPKMKVLTVTHEFSVFLSARNYILKWIAFVVGLFKTKKGMFFMHIALLTFNLF